MFHRFVVISWYFLLLGSFDRLHICRDGLHGNLNSDQTETLKIPLYKVHVICYSFSMKTVRTRQMQGYKQAVFVDNCLQNMTISLKTIFCLYCYKHQM